MANLKIITGATGTTHVQAADDRALNYAAFGGDGILAPNGTYYDSNSLLRGNNVLSASLIDASTVRIMDGDILIQGCHARLEYGQHIDLVIQPGTTGYNRRDVVASHYVKNDLGTESVELVMLTGTPYTGNVPVFPAEIDQTQSLYKSDTEAYSALYVIELTGTKVAKPKLMCDVIKPLHEIGRYANSLARYFNNFVEIWNAQISPSAGNAISALNDESIEQIVAQMVGGNYAQANITGEHLTSILSQLFAILGAKFIENFEMTLLTDPESLYAERILH